MTSIPSSEHQLLAKIRAHESWAQCEDRSLRTAPGRKAFNDRFEQQVDPDNKLTPEERHRRAKSARSAYFARLALKSAQARRRAKDARSQADQFEKVAAQAEKVAAQAEAEAELGGGAA